MRSWSFILILLVITAISATAQPKKQVREGNKLYQQKKYTDAAAAYQKALLKNPTYTPGLFNLGNTLYQQKQYDAARKLMAATAKNTKEKPARSAANYNTGNSYMEEKKWQEAVDAYKEALRNNPRDEDAKYNLSYALSMLKKQQGGGGKNDQDKKDQDKKNEKNNQQDKQEDKKDQNKDQQQQQDENKKEDQQDKRPQPQPSKLSEQQAEQLLNALQQEEKKLQGKMQKGKGAPVKVEKDW